jgi:hypothetical protein
MVNGVDSAVAVDWWGHGHCRSRKKAEAGRERINRLLPFPHFGPPRMRLKIQSAPPLPVLKVWFTVGEECITVADFRSALARELFAFKSKSASSFDLTLDGFDLLEASPLLHVLRDGDLVVVKARETSKKTSGTRFSFVFFVSVQTIIRGRQKKKKEHQS